MPKFINKLPPKEFLNDIFEYLNGEIFWKKSGTGKRISLKAGSFAGFYFNIQINGKKYATHRIIWTMFNGEIPDGMYIDHINGDKVDNRIENLRLASHTENLCNSKIHREGIEPYSWRAYFEKSKKIWIVQKRDRILKKTISSKRFKDRKSALEFADYLNKGVKGE